MSVVQETKRSVLNIIEIEIGRIVLDSKLRNHLSELTATSEAGKCELAKVTFDFHSSRVATLPARNGF